MLLILMMKVNGMDVKVSVNLVNDDGRLKIALLESGCTVKSIGIHINGGASWLYQGVVDAFQKTILTTVENSVSKKMAEKMTKLDSLLQSLPKVRKIDDSVAVNLTFTGNPVLGDSSVEDRIDGLFMPDGEVSPPGGKAEEDDKYDGMTATREAEEGIGLDPSLVDVVTSLEPFLSKVGRKGPLSLWKEKGVRALRRHY